MVGREKELEELRELYKHDQADLVAVYGRRRVGKTFLVKEAFQNNFVFMHAGLCLEESLSSEAKTKAQLEEFYKSLRLYGCKEESPPKDWSDAFFYLKRLLLEKESDAKQVVFLDELPWLDTPGSGFISIFGGFWNSFAGLRKNLLVIVCGSAASWMENELINAQGGLYGRVSHEIKLSPFTLKETREFLHKERGISASWYETAEAYMAVGGIPYYLSYFKKGKSVAQNVNDLFFKKTTPLGFEYERLFNVTFANRALSKRITEFLYKKKTGFSREEIIEGVGCSDNGDFSKTLNALLASDFVTSYAPFGLKRKKTYYKLIDPFCLFYLTFVEKKSAKEDYWITHYGKSETNAWKGLAFENLCFNHVRQIKDKLGIASVGTEVMPWHYEDENEKGQVDMLLKRNDNVLNICEMKFYKDDYRADVEDFKKTNRRIEKACSLLPKRFSAQSVLITTFGLSYGEFSSVFSNVVTLEDLGKF